MSVIIRLQGLPWTANALDIRKFFQGLSIPDGGVHIIGGTSGDAFIAFSTDEDARRAMMMEGKINGQIIKLLLSSKAEMQNVITQARSFPAPQKSGQGAPAPAEPPFRASGPESGNDSYRGPHGRSSFGGKYGDKGRLYLSEEYRASAQNSRYNPAGQQHSNPRGKGPWPAGGGAMYDGYRNGPQQVESSDPGHDVHYRSPPGQHGPHFQRESEGRSLDSRGSRDPRRSPRLRESDHRGVSNYGGPSASVGRPIQRGPDHTKNDRQGPSGHRGPPVRMPDLGDGRNGHRVNDLREKLDQSRHIRQEQDYQPEQDFNTRVVELRRSSEILPPEQFVPQGDIDQRDLGRSQDTYVSINEPDQSLNGSLHGLDDQVLQRGQSHMNEPYGFGGRILDREINEYEQSRDISSHRSASRKLDQHVSRHKRSFTPPQQGIDRLVQVYDRDRTRPQERMHRDLTARQDQHRDEPERPAVYDRGEWNQDRVARDINTDGRNFNDIEESSMSGARHSLDNWNDSLQESRGHMGRNKNIGEPFTEQTMVDANDRHISAPPFKRPLLETPRSPDDVEPRRYGDTNRPSFKDERHFGVCMELSNMPFTVRYDDVSKFFQGIKIARDGIKLCNDHRGRRNGTGVVKFASRWDYDEAMKLNYQLMGERSLQMTPCQLEDFERAVDPYLPKEEDYAPSVKRKREGPLPMEERDPQDSGLWLELSNLHPSTEKHQVRSFMRGFQWAEGSLFVEFDRRGTCMGSATLKWGVRDFESTLRKSGRDPLGKAPSITISPIPWKHMRDKVDKHKFVYSFKGGSFEEFPQKAHSGSMEKDNFSAFLQGLPYDAEDSDVREFFKPLHILDRGIHIVRDKAGRAIGSAYVEFETYRDLKFALQRDKRSMRHRYITVTRYNASRGPSFEKYPPDVRPKEDVLRKVDLSTIGKPGCVLHASNLSIEANKVDILDFFRDYRPITDSVRIHTDVKGQSTGDALVAFRSIGDAKAAVKNLNLKVMKERAIKLKQVHNV
ncbi:LOW QUALITY PROTEIN: uncharacterized protein LOC106173964 [Lingula anatina]|uniref:LOW QUALITY PROTEIN: uncharacterized protein LOC106173964 n=1 Tax=Lingula anatina TaxID=7574 RepID=A0A1S3JK70_LINAN|nr:LOW QUALITY PROTEIN: uncharacterized protein LOC106173964 [Lingula anatina]|eukprot:XP_013410768.1 LOW QUALITY PROTEIN: uncharacterized protein LOC106173964 [Lingula anatina]